MTGIVHLFTRGSELDWHERPCLGELLLLLERLRPAAARMLFLSDSPLLAATDFPGYETLQAPAPEGHPMRSLPAWLLEQGLLQQQEQVFMVDGRDLFMNLELVLQGQELLQEQGHPVIGLTAMHGRPHQYVRLHRSLHQGALYVLDALANLPVPWPNRLQGCSVTRAFAYDAGESLDTGLYRLVAGPQGVTHEPCGEVPCGEPAALLLQAPGSARIVLREELPEGCCGVSWPWGRQEGAGAWLQAAESGLQIVFENIWSAEAEILPFGSDSRHIEDIVQELPVRRGLAPLGELSAEVSGLLVVAYTPDCEGEPDYEIPYMPIRRLWEQAVGAVRLPDGSVITGRQHLTLYNGEGEFVAGSAAQLCNLLQELDAGRVRTLVLPQEHSIIRSEFDYMAYEANRQKAEVQHVN